MPPASNLTLVSNRDSEMEALEARRQTAISALKDAIAKAEGEERDDLEQALERLESAKNPGEIQAALTVAQSTLSREAAGGGSKAAGGNDSQERLDRAWENIGELNKKIDTNFQKLDRYLTDEERAERKKLEEEVEKRKAELERLKNSGASAEEILRAQQALHAAEKQRTEYDQHINDRIRNDPNTSPEDKKTADALARLLEQKLKELEEAQKAALEVYEEKVKADVKDTQKAQEALFEEKRRMAKEREELARKGDIAELRTKITEYNDMRENRSEPNSAIAPNNAEKKYPEKTVHGEQEKYATADANPAEPVSPSLAAAPKLGGSKGFSDFS